MEEVEFKGAATIKVRFRSIDDYRKFRMYILKTEWTAADNYPPWEEMTVEFSCKDDISKILDTVIMILQCGFEVYCCRFQLEEHLVETEHPTEEDPEEPEEIDINDLRELMKRIWKESWK